MFPFQSGELSFQISNNNIDGEHNITNTNTFTTLAQHQLLQLNHPHLANNSDNLIISSPKTKKGRSKSSNKHDNNNANTIAGNNKKEGEISGNNDAAKKKIIHREIERQRRQEMSDLHSSLRSLLPMEYVQGKRSICDHVTEATRYIQDLEKNIKMLGEKRDKLKKSCNTSSSENLPIKRDFKSSSSSNNNNASSSASAPYTVSIQKFSRTLQIEIAAGVEEEDPYPLSKVFKMLDEQGLEVVSSVSSKVNQRWIYVIYCEVNDVTTVDPTLLQEKLMSVVSSDDS